MAQTKIKESVRKEATDLPTIIYTNVTSQVQVLDRVVSERAQECAGNFL